MVKRIFSFLNKEVKGLHEAAYLLAFFALFSQVLALVRDRLLAGNFGASQTLDIYYAAFRIPDFIFISVASLVSVAVLVPFLIERMNKGEKEGKDFVDTMFSFFFLLIIFVSVVAYFLIPLLAGLIFDGFHGEVLEQIITLSRVMLLSPIFLGLSNFLASITQAHKRFFVYAASPVLYNIGIIIGVVFFYPVFGINGLAIGVVLGSVLHLLIQVPFVIEKKMFPKFNLVFDFRSVRDVVLISFPRTIALSLDHIATIVLTSLASFMTVGSISVFNFAFNLQSVPLSIIGVSYSTALFPTLSRHFTEGNKQRYMDVMKTALKHIIFWSIPVTVLFVVLRAQIVRTILGSGNFSWANTRLTAAVLALFVISAVAQSLTLLFVRAYYAGGNTRKPLIINFFFSFMIVLFAYVFTKIFYFFPEFRYFIESLFKVSGVVGTEVLMLSLGYTCSEFLNTAALWIAFEKDFKGFSKGVLNMTFQIFSASVLMGFVAYSFLNIFNNIFDINTLLGIFLQGFCSGIIGIAFGVFVLKLLKNKEIEEVWGTLHRKIWKTGVIVPEQESL